MFGRSQLDSPVCALSGLDKPSVAVRCSRRLYQPRQSTQQSASWTDLPHRCVFAVLSLNSVLVYDTQQSEPLAVASHIHYASLTDATWSADGKCLAVSSSDGYVSIIRFGDEIGQTLERSALEEWLPKSRFAQPIKAKASVPTKPQSVQESKSVVQTSETSPLGSDPMVANSPSHVSDNTQQSNCISPAPTEPSKKRRITPQLVQESNPAPTSAPRPTHPPLDLLSPPLAPAVSTTSGGIAVVPGVDKSVTSATQNPQAKAQETTLESNTLPIKKKKKRATLIFVRE